jgi:hypothetical protein
MRGAPYDVSLAGCRLEGSMAEVVPEWLERERSTILRSMELQSGASRTLRERVEVELSWCGRRGRGRDNTTST